MNQYSQGILISRRMCFFKICVFFSFDIGPLMAAANGDLLEAKLSHALARNKGSLTCLFLDLLALFFSKHFDVAGGAHVWVNATVSAVSAPAHLDSLVNLYVANDHLFAVKTLALCVSLEVGQQIKHIFSALDGPAYLVTRSITFFVKLLSLCVSSSASTVLGEGDSALELQYLLKVSLGFAEFHTFDEHANYMGVLVVSTQLRPASLSRLLQICGFPS